MIEELPIFISIFPLLSVTRNGIVAEDTELVITVSAFQKLRVPYR